MESISKVVGNLVLLLMVGSVVASGQIITSTIVGQVTDATGAAVPGAQLTVRNTGTGISKQVTTDSTGAYTVPELLAGEYEVTVTREGFRTYRRTGIQLLASQSVRIDISLEVGALQQRVDVSAPAPLVQTESASIGGSITTRQINDLPFAYQSIVGLLYLAPGAQVTPGLESTPQTGGGFIYGSHNFTLDGVGVNDTTNGAGAYAYASGGLGLINLPGIGSLQEFKVQEANANAEYRYVGTVTMVTKQGTNQFHGTLYENVQNTKLNANAFVLNASGQPRTVLNLNQFGGNIGGPIRKNKLFFFFNLDGLRQRTPTIVQLTFPSSAMLQNGNFSALCSSYDASGVCSDPAGTQLYDPYSGNPFPNNQIPAGSITSQAKPLLQFIPPPTTAGTLGEPYGSPNYVAQVPTAQDRDGYVGRIDYQLSHSDMLYGVYTHNVGVPWFIASSASPANYGNFANAGYSDQSIAVIETHTFSPSTINDVRVAWFRHGGFRSGQNGNFDPHSLFPQWPGPNGGLPALYISGYTGMPSDRGLSAEFVNPYNVQITDNLTHVRGRHTIKVGIDESGYKQNAPLPYTPLPGFYFSGRWTGNQGWPGLPQSQGNGFADFLLGVADNAYSGTPGVDLISYSRDWEFYAQDTWRATPRLTFYYGVRNMSEAPWTTRDNIRSYMDLNNSKLAIPENSPTPTLPAVGANPDLFAAYPFETTKAIGLPINYIKPDRNKWGPRIGFAFRPFAARNTVLRGGYGIYYSYNCLNCGYIDDSFNPPWGSVSLTYSTNIPGQPTSPYLPDITFQNPFSSGNLGPVASANPAVYSMDKNYLHAMSQQWSFTLEQQFGLNWLVRSTYLGTQTHHADWFFTDLNTPVTQTPNVPIQAQRPYQPWSNIYGNRSGGTQNFNQLQLEVIKRFSDGLQFQVEYQYARSLGNLDIVFGPQNWHFPKQDYGNQQYISRQSIISNFIYELPVGLGKPLLNRKGISNAVLGGWEVSGISQYATGYPFSVKFEIPPSFVGWWQDVFVGNRADRVAGAPLYAGQQHSHDIINGVQWFNPDAFAPPQPWTWGNSARNSVYGPGSWNWDLSVLKNFRIPRTEKHQLQFRADFFDAFNHFNLGGPNSYIADTRDGGLPDATAGKIYYGSGSRIIQLGLRYTF